MWYWHGTSVDEKIGKQTDRRAIRVIANEAVVGSHTLNPSARRHCLCASMSCLQASSPLRTIHSSRDFLESGQAQQIFLLGFTPALPCSGGCCDVSTIAAEASDGDGGDDGMVCRSLDGDVDGQGEVMLMLFRWRLRLLRLRLFCSGRGAEGLVLL